MRRGDLLLLTYFVAFFGSLALWLLASFFTGDWSVSSP